MDELWKAVAGYEGHYEISNLGRVKSLARTYTGRGGIAGETPSIRPLRERILRTYLSTTGYFFVHLCLDGIPRRYQIHRLVAFAFVANPLKYPEVNHLDSCRTNNHWLNLEWTTRSGNLRHAGKRMARLDATKLTASQVRRIRAAFASSTTARSTTKNILARRYDVTPSNIWAIVRRKSWKHVL
jgi:hypothetical protein